MIEPEQGSPPLHYGREMMPEGHVPEVLDAAFPARRFMSLVADKWTIVVLYCLSIRDIRRFNELQRQIPDISKKMLIQTLRSLERDGLLERRVYPEVPPRTDYRLTEAGRKMREPISWLCEWARRNEAFLDDINASRAASLLKR